MRPRIHSDSYLIHLIKRIKENKQEIVIKQKQKENIKEKLNEPISTR